jgi:hypothetical protein
MPRWTRALNPRSSAPTAARAVILAARSAGVRQALLVVLLLNALSAAIKLGVGARTGHSPYSVPRWNPCSIR